MKKQRQKDQQQQSTKSKMINEKKSTINMFTPRLSFRAPFPCATGADFPVCEPRWLVLPIVSAVARSSPCRHVCLRLRPRMSRRSFRASVRVRGAVRRAFLASPTDTGSRVSRACGPGGPSVRRGCGCAVQADRLIPARGTSGGTGRAVENCPGSRYGPGTRRNISPRGFEAPVRGHG